MLAVWALAFGCAVGWDAFVLPWTEFLPTAGPVGTAIGILAGGLVMGIVAWNYHVMINRHPGPGGVYAYATEAFGPDHGFICGWFLCFTYMAIVWMDATVLSMVAHYVCGPLFDFGFHYSVAGHTVHLGHILLSVAGISAAAAVCCSRRLSRAAQILLALAFLGGAVACFAAAARGHDGGLAAAMEPAFVPDGTPPLSQILRLVALAPWLFVGFESVSNLSGEFRFPLRRAFGVMAAALAASVAVYVLLAAIPALVPGDGSPDWTAAVASLGTRPADFAFATAARSFGSAGTAVVAVTLLASIFTNLVGNTLAASRLLSAMAADGVLPAWFSLKAAGGVPRNAVLAIAGLAILVIALGHRTLQIIVDLALVGAALAYAYTSAATFKTARASGDRLSRATGLCGLVLSVAVILLFILPNFTSSASMMSTQSYLVVVLWCIAGLLYFLGVFLRDRSRRFGQSTVVWISLLAVILFMSHMWIRETTYDTTRRAFDEIVRNHSEICIPAAAGPDGGHAADQTDHPVPAGSPDAPAPADWRETLRGKFAEINLTIFRDNFLQISLTVLAFALMLALYSVLRRREREHELEKARAKSYFFSTVSHDIRTPLNAIIGFSEMLQAGFETEAERRQALDAILVSGKTLLGLVNDVLDLSKLESGKMEIVPEPTDCPHLLQGILDAFRIAGGKPGVDIISSIRPMPPLMIDPQRLRQLVFNIVGNAVKFTEKGHIELRASYTRPPLTPVGTFRLEVEDTGCGISEDDLRHIGDAYVQVGAKLARNGGTGLGLAICTQLSKAMGGELGVTSTLGQGSTFTVTLPNVKAVPEAAPGTPSAPAKTADAAPSLKPAAPIRRILIVDDSRMNLMVLKAHLKHLGRYDVTLASNGQEALAVLTAPGAAPYDLVLTDMWMPNLDGTGLLQSIRANPALASLRVVIVTADVEMRTKAADLGFDAILFKPVTSEKLAHLLRP
jgi:signal transduction histidine kinase/CheY-like chemotaxis protein